MEITAPFFLVEAGPFKQSFLLVEAFLFSASTFSSGELIASYVNY